MVFRRRFGGTCLGTYTKKHVFVEYAADNWAVHFRKAALTNDIKTVKSARELCDPRTRHFWTLFHIYYLLNSLGLNDDLPSKGLSDLLIGSRFRLESVVRTILEEKVDPNSKDEYGEFPLSSAASEGHDKVVKLLLANGADIETRNRNGHTALHVAAKNGHEMVVQLLLDEGAHTNATDNDGQTALHIAAGSGYEAIARLLIEKGAKVNQKKKTSVDSRRCTWQRNIIMRQWFDSSWSTRQMPMPRTFTDGPLCMSPCVDAAASQ